MTEKPAQRLDYIDALKGLMVVFVVLGHVIDGYLESAKWPEYENVLSLIFNFIYSFHMPFCFMISGYLYQLAYTERNGTVKRDKIRTHAIDFIIIYIVFCILFWATKLVMSDAVNTAVSIKDIFMIWAVPMSNYWYLYVLVELYFIFSMDKVRNLDIKYMLPLLVGANILSKLIPGKAWFEVSRIAYYALFFYLGMQCRKTKNFFLFRNQCSLICLGVAAIFMIPLLICGKKINIIPVVNMIVALGVSVAMWNALEKNSKFSGGGYSGTPVLRICGINMLEIYVCHIFIIAGLRLLLNKIHVSAIWTCIPVNTIAGLLLPVTLSELSKRLGIHNAIFRPYSYIKGLNKSNK